MFLLPLLSFLLLSVGCGDGHLRGSVEDSIDGKTYLVIADDSNGNCRPIFVDDIEWPHKVGEKAEIAPGIHTIHCGGKIEFEVPEGVVFYFDYWGP